MKQLTFRAREKAGVRLKDLHRSKRGLFDTTHAANWCRRFDGNGRFTVSEIEGCIYFENPSDLAQFALGYTEPAKTEGQTFFISTPRKAGKSFYSSKFWTADGTL